VPPPAPTPVPYRGVNLAGADFGTALPGTDGRDYTFPTASEVDYYMGKGMNTFRVEFLWERIQPSANGAFDATYAGKLDTLVTYATGKGAHVILNPQNFARYYGSTVGSSAVPNSVFADFWSKLGAIYAGNPNVMFNLVNEPNSMATEQWVGAANAAIAAIRAAGATNTIIVPGNAWTGAGSWNDTSYGTSNAVAMLNITDPGNNVLFEAHEYLDADASGSSSTCISESVGVDRLTVWINWLRANGKKGFLGEFAGANNPTCTTAIQNLLTYAMQQTDVLEGWTWWAGGPWWGEYMFTLEPSGTTERPQWSLLSPYLPAP
jgi:endoglucanase